MGRAMSEHASEQGGEGVKLGSWGLWALDFFEGTVRPPREAAALERFEHVGESLQKLLQGRLSLTFYSLTVDHDERLLVAGPEPQLLFIEDLIGFTKTGEAFLDLKEELKLVRRRHSAQLLFFRVALRLERSWALGLTFKPTVAPEAVHRFALLLREPPLSDPRQEHERLLEQMRRRGIGGIELLSKADLVAGEGMESATRLLLTLMAATAFFGTPDTTAMLRMMLAGVVFFIPGWLLARRDPRQG